MARLSRVLDAIERATHDDRRDLTPELRSNIFKYLMGVSSAPGRSRAHTWLIEAVARGDHPSRRERWTDSAVDGGAAVSPSERLKRERLKAMLKDAGAG